uniref:Uncharacterized protein n=1 Tax=Anguilla anguilla TaxID=7936 RepID=A0A0E9THY9_ANGAN
MFAGLRVPFGWFGFFTCLIFCLKLHRGLLVLCVYVRFCTGQINFID